MEIASSSNCSFTVCSVVSGIVRAEIVISHPSAHGFATTFSRDGASIFGSAPRLVRRETTMTFPSRSAGERVIAFGDAIQFDRTSQSKDKVVCSPFGLRAMR